MANATDLLSRIRTGFQRPTLPGIDAQVSMAHIDRNNLVSARKDARKAAVLALFYPDKKGDLILIFIRRSSREPRDRHAGQIGFPGGSVEPEDRDLEQTALRETQEEIGVFPEQVEVLGRLTDLYIPVSNFLVAPYVGYTSLRPDYILQESEVDEVLEIPFADFLKESARQVEDRTIVSGIRLKDVPYWQVGQGTKIWGATAMMTGELVKLAL